ncbi:uncharacterized protein MELLADRAFT_89795 [Melampsora larici-populina 98AG31]|uniref:Uncharacterized protein n=1 Tax=Melampsora larici-populina (strain 98AG31 / pathotype 3-4-7) TaxID=747676 RepID=F4SEB8_MELLP|nr:uncharacterized protein MELLADRAFT_89795 [Melampsora larici-populina 98AG31]EGF97008.1 hypothetical protein MELLADRAFT_89795 [Melampsora larici-populina 98AG31]
MTSQTDDQRMDALKVQKTGFIPMYPDHDSVRNEAQRQKDQGFPPCHCEICEPEECEILVRNLHLFTSSNFEEGLKDPRSLDPDADYSPAGMKAAEKSGTIVNKRKKVNQSRETEDIDFLDLIHELTQVFSDHFGSIYKDQAPFPPSVLFGEIHLNKIIDHIESINTEEDLSEVIGGDALLGSIKHLLKTILDWKSDFCGEQHYKRIKEEKQISDLNNQITIERLEKQDADRKMKQLENSSDQKKKADEKARKSQEKIDERRRKHEQAESKRHKRAQDDIEKEKVKFRNQRMMQWLREGVQENDREAKELEYQRSLERANEISHLSRSENLETV